MMINSNKKDILIILLLIFLSSCVMEDMERQILISTGNADRISAYKADLHGEIIDFGEGIDQFGHCWSKNPKPTIADSISIVKEANKGEFISNIGNLKHLTNYYYRSYAKKGDNVVYGSINSFETMEYGIPLLELNITGGGYENILGNIKLIDLGGYEKFDEIGICWAEEPDPTVEDNMLSLADGISEFNLDNLNDDTQYYLRAYMQIGDNLFYSEPLTIRTYNYRLPEISIVKIKDILNNSFKVEIEIESFGGYESIQNYGVYWEENEEPSTESSKIDLGATSVMEIETLTIDDLDSTKTYYIKAFVENGKGIGYSNTRSVKMDGNVLYSNLAAYYKFNGNTADSSGNENHAINYGAELTSDRFGNPNSAYSFDGLTDYMELTNTLDASRGLSFSFWVNSKGMQEGENKSILIGKIDFYDDYGYNCFNISTYFESNPGLRGSFYADHTWLNYGDCAWSDMMTTEDIPSHWDASKFNLVNPMNLPLNSWVHCVINVTDTEVQAWINGVLTNKKEREYMLYSDFSYKTLIGNLIYRGANNNHFYGAIDDLRVYERGLTEEEIQQLYHEGGWDE